MEGLYLSYLCILVPYHKSWPLVVAQQEQAFLTHSFIGSGLTLLVIMSKIWVVGSAWDVLCVLSLSPVQLFRDSMNCNVGKHTQIDIDQLLEYPEQRNKP